MSTDLVEQNTDVIEQAKQLPAGCDFFKELWELYVPYAEAATEAFRRDWIERHEKGEIELTETWNEDTPDAILYEGDKDGWNMTLPMCIDAYQARCQKEVYFNVFPLCAMFPITDTHREFIVICHARRLDTETALIEMINYFEEFAFLRQNITSKDVYVDDINDIWVEIPKPLEPLHPLFRVWKRAFSYLRPTHSRWPQQKYGELWRDAKTTYAQARMLETSSTTETVIAGLAEAVEKAQDLVALSERDQFDTQAKTLISLSTALYKLLRDEKES